MAASYDGFVDNAARCPQGHHRHHDPICRRFWALLPSQRRNLRVPRAPAPKAPPSVGQSCPWGCAADSNRGFRTDLPLSGISQSLRPGRCRPPEQLRVPKADAVSARKQRCRNSARSMPNLDRLGGLLRQLPPKKPLATLIANFSKIPGVGDVIKGAATPYREVRGLSLPPVTPRP
jgi:hypothetical protein